MKQATGSNLQEAANKVSIQLALDGHSFSVDGLNAACSGEAPVEVEVSTPYTVLVPAELFDETCARQLFAANGIPTADGACIVNSDPGAEVIALMAVGSDAAGQVNEKLGVRARYTTPLLQTPDTKRKTVWVCQKPGLLYIKVYDGKLRFAEVIPAASEAEVLYFFDRLGRVYKLSEYLLWIAPMGGGKADSGVKALRKLLVNRFNDFLCE